MGVCKKLNYFVKLLEILTILKKFWKFVRIHKITRFYKKFVKIGKEYAGICKKNCKKK